MNKSPSPQLAPACHFEGTFSHVRGSLNGASFLLLPHCGLADAIRCEQSFICVDAAKLLRSDGPALRNRAAALHVIVRQDTALEILLRFQQVCIKYGQSFGICAPAVSIRV